MCGLPWRTLCVLALFLPMVLTAQAASPPPAQARFPFPSSSRISDNASRLRARQFVQQRLPRTGSAGMLRLRGMRQRIAMPHLLPGDQPWQPVGPSQIATPQFGDVTGRVTSIAVASWDASGNTVYIGSTGGGVWRSSNAAATDPGAITFTPLTDDPSAFSGVNITSLSMGAVSVQPGNSVDGVVLAGTGDPNDALDSYYGAGILRSADGGATWSLITQSSDAFSGGITNYSFVGDAFSGFAWSTANPNLVVAAVTDSYDGFVNNINNSSSVNVAEAGLYYSTDAGQTWFLATIEDGPHQVIESSQTTVPSVFPGVPVSAVVWNPVRQMFYAAVQYHGYYQSPDGVTWTRLANQPGGALSSSNCPSNPGTLGSNSCAIFRGVLAVQPVTGDMFALTVDANGVDQGLWQDVCNAGAGGCASATVQFAVQIPDAPLDDGAVAGTIPQGTYNLALAAVPSSAGTGGSTSGDTLLFAGTQDIFRCSLAAGCVWRNTTNATSCAAAMVAPAQHAIAALTPAGQSLPLLYFGNDGGLWRSTDGVNQTGAVCSAGDAAHFENLNGGLGSLSEVTGLANSATDANTLLAGFGVNGSAATTTMGASAWPQLLSEQGGLTAIDPTNPENWYATLGAGVSIAQCTQGANCTTADFGTQPAIGASETGGDQALLTAPYGLDSADSANMIVGTCRVWRGPASGGAAWSSANAISPMLDGRPEPFCNGNALIRSVASGGANIQPGTGAQNSGAQVLYAGMAGLLDGGGASVGGHVFSTQTANTANASTPWMDLALSPVANEQSYGGVFNPYAYDVSALYVDPHDPTGNTVYAAIQGFGVPHLYLSTNGGASWTNITKNLPDLPLNDVMVDPNDASVVYAASDGGVFVTQNVTNCELSGGQCWNILGTGLPLAPAVKLSSTAMNGGLLRVGTYGRGIWQTQLLSGVPQTTMTLTPATLTFPGQPVQTTSSAQSLTVTNTGSTGLMVSSVATAGDFAETDNCSGTIASGASCQIQVTFTPSATGTRTGSVTVTANIAGGQQSVALTGTGTAGTAIEVLPNSVNFGGQAINTTSAAQQVTVSNTSTAPIGLTSESVTGPFSIQTNTCSASLPANTGCTLAIVFTPVQTGAASGTLTVVSAQGTETVGLNGSGENPPTDTLAPLSLAFPQTLENSASAPQTVTLTNSGGAPLTAIQVQTAGDFSVVNGCAYSLNAQSSCALTVRYTPHATGVENGTITVTDALRIQTVTLTGTGLAPPTDTLSATALVFPATVVGQSAPPQSVTVTNSGDVALNQLSLQTVGAGFSESSTCGSTLAAHTSCSIAVTFHATAAGAAAGQLDVADALRTQIVALSGQGETPAQDNLSPLSLNFGTQAIGTPSAAQTVTLANNGQAVLTGIQVQSSNPDFHFTTGCGTTLQPGNACGIQVIFSPHLTGPQTAILTVTDAVRTQQIAMSGTGTLANVTLVPASLNFGSIGVQISSSAQTLTLSNGSNTALAGISFAMVGAYTQTNTCGATLPSGAACTIAVAFSPTATGSQAGTLTVSSTNAPAMTASLAGIGIAYTLSPTSPTSVTVSSGHAASYSLELTPASGSAGTVSLSCANLPPNSTCTVSPSSASLVAPTGIQVAIATGVGSAAAGASKSRMVAARAGFGNFSGWPRAFLPVWLFALLSLWGLRRRFGRLRLRGVEIRVARLLPVLLVVLAVSWMAACGKGVGPLGASATNPLPDNSTTPPGNYTVAVSASAGGLVKTVSLTVQVQ